MLEVQTSTIKKNLPAVECSPACYQGCKGPHMSFPLHLCTSELRMFLKSIFQLFQRLTSNLSFTARNAWNLVFPNPSKSPLLSFRTVPLHLNTHSSFSLQSAPLETLLVTTCRENTLELLLLQKDRGSNLLQMLFAELG